MTAQSDIEGTINIGGTVDSVQSSEEEVVIKVGTYNAINITKNEDLRTATQNVSIKKEPINGSFDRINKTLRYSIYVESLNNQTLAGIKIKDICDANQTIKGIRYSTSSTYYLHMKTWSDLTFSDNDVILSEDKKTAEYIIPSTETATKAWFEVTTQIREGAIETDKISTMGNEATVYTTNINGEFIEQGKSSALYRYLYRSDSKNMSILGNEGDNIVVNAEINFNGNSMKVEKDYTITDTFVKYDTVKTSNNNTLTLGNKVDGITISDFKIIYVDKITNKVNDVMAPSMYTVTYTDGNKAPFTIKFNEEFSDAIKITYKAKISKDIIKNKLTNQGNETYRIINWAGNLKSELIINLSTQGFSSWPGVTKDITRLNYNADTNQHVVDWEVVINPEYYSVAEDCEVSDFISASNYAYNTLLSDTIMVYVTDKNGDEKDGVKFSTWAQEKSLFVNSNSSFQKTKPFTIFSFKLTKEELSEKKIRITYSSVINLEAQDVNDIYKSISNSPYVENKTQLKFKSQTLIATRRATMELRTSNCNTIAKKGIFDFSKQLFNWEITYKSNPGIVDGATNTKLTFSIKDAKIVDILPEGHKYVEDSLIVRRTVVGSTTVSNEEVPATISVVDNVATISIGDIDHNEITTIAGKQRFGKGYTYSIYLSTEKVDDSQWKKTTAINKTSIIVYDDGTVQQGIRAEATVNVDRDITLTKKTNYTSGDMVTWEVAIDVNSNGVIAGENLVIEDYLPESLTYDNTCTVTMQDKLNGSKVTLEKPTYDATTRLLSIKIPNSINRTRSYIVTFTTKVKTQGAKFNNSITLKGSWEEFTTSSNTIVLKNSNSSGTITYKNANIWLKKINEKNQPLKGAEFSFKTEFLNTPSLNTTKTIVFNSTDPILIDQLRYGDDDDYNTPSSVKYILQETKAPEGYILDSTVYTIEVGKSKVDPSKVIYWINGKQVNQDLVKSGEGGSYLSLDIVNQKDVPVTLKAKKYVNGANATGNAYQFTLTKTDAQGKDIVGEGKYSETVNNNGLDVQFSELTFNTIGTYYYTVKEVNNNVANTVYDNTVYNVEVEIKKDAETNKLVAVPTITKGLVAVESMEFNNYNDFKGELELAATKQVNGRNPIAGETFSFSLVESNSSGVAKAGATVNTVNNTGSEVKFTKINYTLADVGTKYYLIKENETSLSGYSTSADQYIVQVDISRPTAPSTTLTVVKTIRKKGSNTTFNSITFNNTLTLQAKVSVEAEKTIGGNEPTADQKFDFTLTKVNELGEEVTGNDKYSETVSNNGKTIKFKDINVSLDDVGKTLYYQITEKAIAATSDYVIDTVKYTVEIKVSAPATVGGALQVVKTVKKNVGTTVTTLKATDKIAFNNTYDPAIDWQFAAIKYIDTDEIPAADEVFNFTMVETDEDFVKLNNGYTSTVSNVLSDIQFKKISFTRNDIGTKRYFIVTENELVPTAPFIACGSKYQVSIEVIRNTNGKLAVIEKVEFVKGDIIKDVEEAIFRNERKYYDEKFDDMMVEIAPISKKLEGRALVAGEFTFGLYEKQADDSYKLVETVANDENGKIKFTHQVSSKNRLDQDIIFKIKEIKPSQENSTITYDSKEYFVNIMFTRNAAKEVVVAKHDVYYVEDNSNVKVNKIEFENTYYIEGKTSLSAKKTVNNAAPKANEVFNFTLTRVDQDGNALDGDKKFSETKQNVLGDITFSDINLTLNDVGTPLYYKVVEEVSTVDHYTSDKTVYMVKIDVTDNNGTLESKKTVTYVNGTTSGTLGNNQAITFNNTYYIEGKTGLSAKKTVNNAAPKANEVFNFTLTRVDQDGNALDGDKKFSETKQNVVGDVTFSDIDLTLNDVGTPLYYKVVEEVSTVDHYTSDKTVYMVKIDVTDNNGTLESKKTVTYVNGTTSGTLGNNQAITFNNTYYIEGKTSLSAKKTVNNAAPKANEVFNFTLTRVDQDGNVLDGDKKFSETKQNVVGDVTFSDIDLTLNDVGTPLYYKVVEEVSTVDHYTSDKTVYMVKIDVTDNNGTLESKKTVTYVNGTTSGTLGNNQAITFNNTYYIEGKTSLSAKKTVNNEAPKANEVFNFTLTRVDQDGNALDGDKKFSETKQNVVGDVTFSDIDLTLNDVGTPLYYKVVEEVSTVDHYTSDKTVYMVKIDVTDNNGALESTKTITAVKGLVAEAANEIIFNNTYEPKAEWQLSAFKFINEEDTPTDEEVFGFTMIETDSNFNELPSGYVSKVKNNLSAISFDKITFTKEDIATKRYFKISEDVLTTEPYIACGSQYLVTLSINRNETTGAIEIVENSQFVNGTVKKDVEEVIFRNKPKHFDETFTNIMVGIAPISKRLTGRALVGDEFEFALLERQSDLSFKSVETVKNDASGKIEFNYVVKSNDNIGKDIVFKIVENKPAQLLPDITYDSREYYVLIRFKEVNHAAVLDTYKVYYLEGSNETSVSSIQFNNTYTAGTQTQITATKTLQGHALHNAMFTFSLLDNQNKVIQQVKNDGNGIVTFAPIYYTKELIGTHTYTVVEEKIDDRFIYDISRYTVTVTVADKGNGVLQATQVITKDGKVVTDIKFHNCYNPPMTGDNGMGTYSAIAVLSFLAIIGLRRKMKA